MNKNFKLNLMVRSFLHSIAIAKDSEEVNVESSKQVIKILIHYATTFFVDLENWKQINDFKNLNPAIAQIVRWLVGSFGDLKVSDFLDFHIAFSLKQFARNQIRRQLRYEPSVLCNQQAMMALGLPEVLSNYVAFKE